MNREQMQTRYLDLIEITLPSLGRTRGWEFSEPHQFQRVVLDHVFRGNWHHHLRRGLRPHKNLNDIQFAQAVSFAEKLVKATDAQAAAMDAQSRAWRERAAAPKESRSRTFRMAR